MNSLSVPQIHYGSAVSFPFRLWIHYFFANSLWINNVSRKFTINSSYFAIQFTINFLIVYEFTIYLAIWLWIDYLSHLFTVNSLSFRKYTMNLTMNSPSFISNSVMIHYFFFTFIASSLWIRWFFEVLMVLAMNSLSLSRTYHEFIMILPIPVIIHIFLRIRNDFSEIKINWLFLLWIHYNPAIIIANSPWIHCGHPDSTLNSLFNSNSL